MALVIALGLANHAAISAHALRAGIGQPAIEVKELADYRLTAPVLSRFGEASRLIAGVTRSDSAFADAPLFTREVLVLGDAATIANELASRLDAHPRLAAALRQARITSRDYTKFAVALFAARLAHGFVTAGVLRRVPPGVAADNVAFVAAHDAEISGVLQALGLEDAPTGS